jgi:hypothetical protein
MTRALNHDQVGHRSKYGEITGQRRRHGQRKPGMLRVGQMGNEGTKCQNGRHIRGLCARRTTHSVTSAKNRQRRRLATTMIMPNSKMMVSVLTASIASGMVRTLHATIKVAPMIAAPVRSTRNPGQTADGQDQIGRGENQDRVERSRLGHAIILRE